MAIEVERFRIVKDPKQAGKWAYQLNGSIEVVGGFRSSQEARKACDRALRQPKRHENGMRR